MGVLCGATLTGGQMARKTAGVEEFDFLRVQTRKLTHTSLDDVPLHRSKTKVFDAIKQGLDEIIQKTKLKMSKEHPKSVDETTPLALLTITDNIAITEATDSTTNEPTTTDPTTTEQTETTTTTTAATGDASTSNDPPIINHLANNDASAEVEIFTEHVHKSNKATHSAQESPHPVSNGESLVIGNHNTFKGLHTIVGIPGWANGDNDPCICESWARAMHSMFLMCLLFCNFILNWCMQKPVLAMVTALFLCGRVII